MANQKTYILYTDFQSFPYLVDVSNLCSSDNFRYNLEKAAGVVINSSDTTEVPEEAMDLICDISLLCYCVESGNTNLESISYLSEDDCLELLDGNITCLDSTIGMPNKAKIVSVGFAL